MKADYKTKCENCKEVIEEGDDIFFDDGKLCSNCADLEGLVCECGEYKKPEYDTCWACKESDDYD